MNLRKRGSEKMKQENSLFKVTLPEDNLKFEKLEYKRGNKYYSLGHIRYHVKFWQEAAGPAKTIILKKRYKRQDTLILCDDVAEIGKFSIEYRLDKKQPRIAIRYCFECKAKQSISIGFFFSGIEPPKDTTDLRLLPGVYSGYTVRDETFLWSVNYNNNSGIRQMSLAVDQERIKKGTTRMEYQYLTLSFPPAYKDGVVTVCPGEKVTGEVVIEQRTENIWDPSLKQEELAVLKQPNYIEPPRFSYSQYIKNWEHYIQDPDLWVDLGNNMGMFHVGFYNLLKEPKKGGPYGYELKGKPVRYKELYEIMFGKRRHEQIKLSFFQTNIRQLEIGWGNGYNTIAAYTLYRHGKKWALKQADQIINAVLGLKKNGFQIMEGPLNGAWINGYDASSEHFQDHYGGQQVFLPDQGIVNYFLARCFLEGYSKDNRIIERIKYNCEEFILPLEKKFGTYPNAFSPDGSTGYSREAYKYDSGIAPGIALSALSLVVLYELTKKKQYLTKAEDIISRFLAPLLEQNKFGFLEYDHNGWDSSGACMMLMTFAEYLNIPDANKKRLVRKLQKKVFYYLLGFRHEHDYFLYEHSQNVLGWNGIARNKFGFLHGFTPESRQGEYSLHLRYEYGYALLRTFETWNNPLVYSALINYLNYYTYQQFVNAELKKGFGGCTEHTALSTYIQDTTHIGHSTPLTMILLQSRPIYLLSTNGDLKNIKFSGDMNELDIAFGHIPSAERWLMIDGAAKNFTLNNKTCQKKYKSYEKIYLGDAVENVRIKKK